MVLPAEYAIVGHTISMFPIDKREHKEKERRSKRRDAFKKGVSTTESFLSS